MVLQLGIIVRDLEAAIEDYSSLLGIGPFDIMYVDRVGVRAAVAPLGPVEVELIQPVGDSSPMWDFLGDSQARIHHLGFYIADMDAQVARFQELGVGIVQRVQDLGVESTLLDLKKRAGIDFELLHKQP
jgi:methylmalonyl-CoA/ethylmalonyl-CoA epimerase